MDKFEFKLSMKKFIFYPKKEDYNDWQIARARHVIDYINNIIRYMKFKQIQIPTVELIFNTLDVNVNTNFTLDFVEYSTEGAQYLENVVANRIYKKQKHPALPILSGPQCPTFTNDISFPATLFQNEYAQWNNYANYYKHILEIGEKNCLD